MRTSDDVPANVRIGGKKVPVLYAALIAREADRRNVTPGEVGKVTIPRRPPTHVRIAGKRFTLYTAAVIGSVADSRRVTPREVIASVLIAHFATRARRTGGVRPGKRTRRRAP